MTNADFKYVINYYNLRIHEDIISGASGVLEYSSVQEFILNNIAKYYLLAIIGNQSQYDQSKPTTG